MKPGFRIRFVAAAIVSIAGPGFHARAQTLQVYFGNLHAHTSYSDGSGTPAMAYDHARIAGLDFMAITEHNHAQAESGAGNRRDGLLIATTPALYAATRRGIARRWWTPRRTRPSRASLSRYMGRSSARSAAGITRTCSRSGA